VQNADENFFSCAEYVDGCSHLKNSFIDFFANPLLGNLGLKTTRINLPLEALFFSAESGVERSTSANG
jgi:hypothetical protein